MKRSLLLFGLLGIVLMSNAQLQAPALWTPADNSVLQTPLKELNWRPALGGVAASYDIEVDDNSGFTSPLLISGVTATSTVVSELLFGQQYFWRVRANPLSGAPTAWSTEWSFTTLDEINLGLPTDIGESDTARGTIVIDDYRRLDNDTLTVDGVQFIEGVDFSSGSDNIGTATNLMNTINGITSITDQLNVTQSGTTINFTAVEPGSSFNSIALGHIYAVLIPVEVDASLTGGLDSVTADGGFKVTNHAVLDNDIITIAGISLTESTDFNKGANAAGAATNIVAAINAHPTLQNLVTASRVGDTITVVANSPGFAGNFALGYTDSGTGVSMTTSGAMTGGDDGVSAEGEVRVMSTRMVDAYRINVGTNVLTAGLDFIVDPDRYITASNIANAINGTFSDISATSLDSLVTITFIESGVVGNLAMTYTDFGSSVTLSGNTISGGDNPLLHVEADIKWDTIPGVLSYQYQYDIAPAFNTPNMKSGIVAHTENEVTISELLFNTQYYWRVRAIHAQDTSAWAQFHSFVTPKFLVPQTPGNATTGISPDTALTAATMKGVEDYEFEVDTNAVINSSSVEYSHGISTDPKFSVSELLYGQTYYWRLKGINSNGMSAWNEPWTFQTASTVEQTSPDDGADVSMQPTLEWDALPGTVNYQVQLAEDLAMTIGLNQFDAIEGQSELTVPNKLALGTYFWRARAYHARDTSDWSTVRSFVATPVGITEKDISPLVAVFPNPVKDVLNVSLENFNQSIVTINIVDMRGTTVLKRNVSVNASTNVESINLNGISSGMYMILVQGNEKQFSQKITVNK